MSDNGRRKINFPTGYDADGGLTCRICGCRHFSVKYTRKSTNGIKRVRECRNCGHVITTIEKEKPTDK